MTRRPLSHILYPLQRPHRKRRTVSTTKCRYPTSAQWCLSPSTTRGSPSHGARILEESDVCFGRVSRTGVVSRGSDDETVNSDGFRLEDRILLRYHYKQFQINFVNYEHRTKVPSILSGRVKPTRYNVSFGYFVVELLRLRFCQGLCIRL